MTLHVITLTFSFFFGLHQIETFYLCIALSPRGLLIYSVGGGGEERESGGVK